VAQYSGSIINNRVSSITSGARNAVKKDAIVRRSYTTTSAPSITLLHSLPTNCGGYHVNTGEREIQMVRVKLH